MVHQICFRITSCPTAQQLVDSASVISSVQITSTGMNVLDNSSNKLAQFSNTVTVGRDDGTNQNVFIDSDSIDIRRGTQVTIFFGATTYNRINR